MCTGQLPVLLTVTSQSAGLCGPRREKGAALTGSVHPPWACKPTGPFGPRPQAARRPGCCAVLNISQLWEAAPANAGQVAARLRAVGLVEDGRRWQQAGFPAADYTRNAATGRKGAGARGGCLYRPCLSRPRLTVGAARGADRWEL